MNEAINDALRLIAKARELLNSSTECDVEKDLLDQAIAKLAECST